MPKKYSTTKTLVIVESPAKCSKIEEYLGPGYKCIASFGHLRELASLKNINFENNYFLTFTNIQNSIKQKQIEKIRKEIAISDDVILMCDNDREGESICWHLCQLFNLDVSKTKRIIFNEITQTAIQHAIKNPTIINMDLVRAQQARQVLDLLVGFKITPILWKYINYKKENALSAGRCQTPALKLIYDNYKELKCSLDVNVSNDSNNNSNNKIYNVYGYFTRLNLQYELNKSFESNEKILEFLEESTSFKHIYTYEEPKKLYKPPPEPFTTSRIQQASSNEYHYSPKDTMKYCQTLYELGYITYMRTDSKKYSAEFVGNTKEYIKTNYGASYVHKDVDLLINTRLTDTEIPEVGLTDAPNSAQKYTKVRKQKKEEASIAQEAHEAIRPTNIMLRNLPDNIGAREKKLYKLIWENTIESCMTEASYLSITSKISAPLTTNYSYSAQVVEFPGWKVIKQKYDTQEEAYNLFKLIQQNSTIPYKKIASKFTIKNIKSHYSESKLVQLLEEKGIGRPSTYSMIIDKIQERGYVKKEDVQGLKIDCIDYELIGDEIYEINTTRTFGNEKNKLVIQQMGIIVIEFLDTYFNELFNYDYTKNMEDELDIISKGHGIWYDVCEKCNKQIDNLIKNIDIKTKIEYKIDDNNYYIIGKYGPVIKCILRENDKEKIVFKKVKQDIDILKLKNGEYKLEDVCEEESIDTNNFNNNNTMCDKSDIVNTTKNNDNENSILIGRYEDNDVYIKKGKFGTYLSYGENKKTLKEFGNRPINNIRFEEIEHLLQDGSNIVRNVSNNITIRKSKRGDYVFFKTSNMKKPKFFPLNSFKEDYKNCDINILKEWLKTTHQIY